MRLRRLWGHARPARSTVMRRHQHHSTHGSGRLLPGTAFMLTSWVSSRGRWCCGGGCTLKVARSHHNEAKTIPVLREMFARNCLPRHLVSDNGPQFCLEEFRHFMLANGIRHTRTAPYHPASNGAAERLVQ